MELEHLLRDPTAYTIMHTLSFNTLRDSFLILGPGPSHSHRPEVSTTQPAVSNPDRVANRLGDCLQTPHKHPHRTSDTPPSSSSHRPRPLLHLLATLLHPFQHLPLSHLSMRHPFKSLILQLAFDMVHIYIYIRHGRVAHGASA